MSTRTTHTIVHFSSPFALRGLDEVQPPGDYEIDEDEELIEGISWLAYRRVATLIHLPAIAPDSRTSQLIAIDHAELEAVLQQDRDRREGGATDATE